MLTRRTFVHQANAALSGITSQDICSLIRRIYGASSGGGSSGVRFDPPMAMDLIMLASRLCS
jgi:hypothetical protein